MVSTLILNFDPLMAKSLTERDRQVIWHPYTQHKNQLPPIPILQGKGSLLFDDRGNSYIDAISSWWVTIHGHGHPYIAEKLYAQARQLEHVIFTGFTHEPAVQLAEKLLAILPGDFSKVFYSDNGSTAVEVAIKMVLQYWQNLEPGPGGGSAGTDPGAGQGYDREVGSTGARGAQKVRNKILAFRHSYHGDTFGAMSVSERSIFTAAFREHLFDVVFIDTPTADNIAGLQSFLRERAGEIAGFIYEPLLQAAGGMRIYDPVLMDSLLDTARSGGILCIADEVLTGFGRTGRLFASEYLQHKADIICLSKALTGGTLALGVTAVTEPVFGAFLSDDRRRTFFHGHSFTANPLACAAALASLDLLEREDCLSRIQNISRRHIEFGERIQKLPVVKNLRSLGTVLAFEINTGRDEYINSIGTALTQEALQNGLYLRPLGNTVYLMPPYCITEKEMDQVYTFLVRYLESFQTAGARSADGRAERIGDR